MVWEWKNSPFLNALGGIPAIYLSLPVVLTGIKEDAWRTLYQMYRSRIRRAAAIEVDVLPSYDHKTAEVLYQKLQICLYCRSAQTF